MIRLGARGVEGTATLAERRRLRRHVERFAHVRLPGFLTPEAYEIVQAQLARTEFEEYVSVANRESRQRPKERSAEVFLWLSLRDPAFLSFVEDVLGCGSIRGVTGTVARMEPGTHRLGWHTDLEAGSRIGAMTLNLSPAPVKGGRLQLRRRGEEALIADVPYSRARDVIFFRIGLELEHRSTMVEGRRPKTIYAGWFHSKPVDKAGGRA